MAFDFNPITGNLDLVDSPAGYINGVVANPTALPVTLGSPPMDAVYLCKAGSGVWLINRKPAGLYCRVANDGDLDDWQYLGAFPEVNADGNWALYNSATPSKELKFDLSGLPTATVRTVTAPAGNGQMLVEGQSIGATTPASGAFTTLTASATTTTGTTHTIGSTFNSSTSTFDGTISGTTLTVLSVASGTIEVGMDLHLNSNGNFANTITALGTGTGGTGTYTVAISQASTTNTYVGRRRLTALRFDTTDTLSAAGSLLADFRVGGTTRAAITKGGGLTLTSGTVTASAPVLDATQTWNDAANTFVGLRFTATNTASNLSSDLIQLRVGATTMFNVRRDGAVAAADSFNAGGCIMQSNSFRAGSAGSLTFTNGGGGTSGSFDTSLSREAAGVFRMTAPAAGAAGLLLYNTTTTATNYERGFMRWSSNVLQIGTEKLGTGTARALELQTDGVTRMVISATGDVGIASTSAPTGGFGSAVIGQLNTASGNASYVLGRDSTASSTWAVALAYRSLADRNAMLAFAGGRFAARGDAQNARFVLRCTTTTNAAVEMFLGDTTTTYLTIPSGKVIFCNIKVVGVKSDGSVVATYERQYAAKNVAGTSSEVFAPVTIGTDNASSTSLEIATVDAGDYIRIRPTGIASETWRWVATVDAVEVAYGA